jgi:hypothetical protein
MNVLRRTLLLVVFAYGIFGFAVSVFLLKMFTSPAKRGVGDFVTSLYCATKLF